MILEKGETYCIKNQLLEGYKPKLVYIGRSIKPHQYNKFVFQEINEFNSEYQKKTVQTVILSKYETKNLELYNFQKEKNLKYAMVLCESFASHIKQKEIKQKAMQIAKLEIGKKYKNKQYGSQILTFKGVFVLNNDCFFKFENEIFGFIHISSMSKIVPNFKEYKNELSKTYLILTLFIAPVSIAILMLIKYLLK